MMDAHEGGCEHLLRLKRRPASGSDRERGPEEIIFLKEEVE